MGVGETVGRGWVWVVVDVLGIEIEFSVLFLEFELESESGSEFLSLLMDESLNPDTFLK